MGATSSICLPGAGAMRALMPRNRSQKFEDASQSGVGTVDTQYRNTTLLSLPTELIEAVVQEMDDDDVYSLSLLSRRLHFVALPIFISRQPSTLSHGCLHLYSSPLKLLRAARIALFVQQLEVVTVDLLAQEPILSIFRALGRLFSRMRHVQSVSFDWPIFFTQLLDNDQVVKGLAGLMDILREKACTAVIMSGMVPQSGRIGTRRSEISPLTTLRSLDIYFSVIASPPIRSWIIHTINTSPITRLSLTEVSLSADKSSFAKDLRLLTLPCLTDLSIVCRENLPFDQLVAFLCRHHRILFLTLKCDTVINSSAPELPENTLPSLHTLHTTPRYIQHFLRPRGSLPSLRHVDIDPDLPPRLFNLPGVEQLSTGRLVDLEGTLECLAPRDRITSLGIFLPLDGVANNWLTMGCHPQRGKRMDIERSLVHIKTFHLRTNLNHLINEETMSLIPKWLSLFPDLQYADISGVLGFKSSAEDETFLRAVADACPGMQIVRLGLFNPSRTWD